MKKNNKKRFILIAVIFSFPFLCFSDYLDEKMELMSQKYKTNPKWKSIPVVLATHLKTEKMSPEFHKMTVLDSLDELQIMLDVAKKKLELITEYPFDGCSQRVLNIWEFFSKKGIFGARAFSFGKFKVYSRMKPLFTFSFEDKAAKGFKASWNYHTAAIFLVQDKIYVLDPVLANFPLDLTEWSILLGIRTKKNKKKDEKFDCPKITLASPGTTASLKSNKPPVFKWAEMDHFSEGTKSLCRRIRFAIQDAKSGVLDSVYLEDWEEKYPIPKSPEEIKSYFEKYKWLNPNSCKFKEIVPENFKIF